MPELVPLPPFRSQAPPAAASSHPAKVVETDTAVAAAAAAATMEVEEEDTAAATPAAPSATPSVVSRGKATLATQAIVAVPALQEGVRCPCLDHRRGV